MYDDFFAKAHELVQKGVPFVTAVKSLNTKAPLEKALIFVRGGGREKTGLAAGAIEQDFEMA